MRSKALLMTAAAVCLSAPVATGLLLQEPAAEGSRKSVIRPPPQVAHERSAAAAVPDPVPPPGVAAASPADPPAGFPEQERPRLQAAHALLDRERSQLAALDAALTNAELSRGELRVLERARERAQHRIEQRERLIEHLERAL